jgi:hypothetical protein
MYKDNRSNLNILNVGSCVYGYEISVSLKGWDFPELPVALRPYEGHGLFIPVVSRSHTTTRHTR